jgi:hypothetical protein
MQIKTIAASKLSSPKVGMPTNQSIPTSMSVLPSDVKIPIGANRGNYPAVPHRRSGSISPPHREATTPGRASPSSHRTESSGSASERGIRSPPPRSDFIEGPASPRSPTQRWIGGSFLRPLLSFSRTAKGPRPPPVHQRQYSTSQRPSPPRRVETISVLPPGVKMPTGDQPEVLYGADGSKYLVIPSRRDRAQNLIRPRQIIVTSGPASPSPHRMVPSNSTPRRETPSPLHPPPKIVGDPERTKQYEASQRNVARWIEAVGDPATGRSSSSKRTTTR